MVTRRLSPASRATGARPAAPESAAARGRAAALLARPFTRNLLLPRVFAALFGQSPEGLSRVLAAASAQRDVSGASGCARALLALGGSALAPATLLRWDASIGGHEASIREARAAHAASSGESSVHDFALTHFQWLACAVVEWHLEALVADTSGHVSRIEAVRAGQLPQLSPYTAADARKLACFMATGAGKTLVLHMNLRQFFAHRLFEPQCVLLLTPGEALSAQHAAELEASGLLALRVQVSEITKFYVDSHGARRPKKGVSEGTTRYEGPNLLLVDEGHKGGTSEAGTERAWRAVREALAAGVIEANAGFTFEYSATFAQIADKNAALHDEYARCVSIDFGYARFWREGYGKEPRLVNASAEAGADFALAAGLLAFYQQRRAFDEQPALAADYLVAPPLMACVGKDVTAGEADSDVAALLKFLVRACGDPAWLANRIADVLAHSGPAQATVGLPALDFAYLRRAMASSAQSAAQVAADLARRVFGGAGRIESRLISEKEVGLRSLGAASDAYFGVIRVGEAKKLAVQLGHHGIVAAGAPDRLVGSLFARLDLDPRLTVLIGAKMFVEGWSSWRVSALGLMNVGRTPGAEIVQLFGRGVRLRGRGHSLKREPEAPESVRVLQSLQVFGVRADYMAQYLETLAREGVTPQWLHVPVAQLPDMEALGLKTLAADDLRFAEPVVFDGATARARRERIEPAVQAAAGLGPAHSLGAPLAVLALSCDWLDVEVALQHALHVKRRNRWFNLVVSATAIRTYLLRCNVEAPVGHFDDPVSSTARRAQVAIAALESGLAAAWYDAERRWRMQRLEVAALNAENAGLPWAEIDGQRRLAWRLEINVAHEAALSLLGVAREQVAQGVRDPAFVDRLLAFLASEEGSLSEVAESVTALLADTDELNRESLLLPLPRLHVPQHLYSPLLLKQALRPAAVVPLLTGEQMPLFAAESWVDVPIKISPPALNASEAKFVWDLRSFWQKANASAPWNGVDVFLLRNPAAGGLTLYRSAGFAPDFMLWLKRGNQQALGLIDPKGLARAWPADKLSLLDELERSPLSIPVRGFLISATAPESMALPPGLTADVACMRSQRVLLQDDKTHVEYLLECLLAALDPPELLNGKQRP